MDAIIFIRLYSRMIKLGINCSILFNPNLKNASDVDLVSLIQSDYDKNLFLIFLKLYMTQSFSKCSKRTRDKIVEMIESKSAHADEVVSIFVNNTDLIKEENELLKMVSIILSSKEKWNARNAGILGSNKKTVESGLAVDLAQLSAIVKKEFQSDDICILGCNENALKSGVALRVSSLICKTADKAISRKICDVCCRGGNISDIELLKEAARICYAISDASEKISEYVGNGSTVKTYIDDK